MANQSLNEENTFTIRGIDRDKRGTVFCKTTSRCGGQATGYKIGRLLPVLLPDGELRDLCLSAKR